MAWSRGHIGRSKQGTGREKHMLLLRLINGMCWSSQARPGFVNSKQSGVFKSFMWVLSKGCQKGRPWKVGATIYHTDC